VTTEPLRVLVCDDSAAARAAVIRILDGDPGLHVTARARNGEEAVAAIRAGGIDVAVLDLEMPVMDGLTALPLMLRADPALRVIVASALTTRGAAVAMEALRRGAADCLAKPAPGQDAAFAADLLARAKGNGALRRRREAGGSAMPAPAPAPRPAIGLGTGLAVLAIGASTGGPEALGTVMRAFRRLPAIPVLITQHMPNDFIPMLAEHLSRLGPTQAAVARDGDQLVAGRVLLAPGDRHMIVGADRLIRLSNDPPEHFCRPAVDPMLRSIAAVFGRRCAAAVLTGMGHDGGAGAAAVAEAGGVVLAQDAATSVVWGMPGAVVERRAASEVLPLPELARRLAELAGAA
jgi:two-component system chemotaxis response regulator CheB